MTFDIQEILGLLPHRYPFLLIDRVVEFESGKRLVALKNVTINEPFFQGHFPGYPIMPAVLVIEAMAQAGAIIMLSELPTGRRNWRLHGHREGQVPQPGDAGRSTAHRGERAGLQEPHGTHGSQGDSGRQAGLRGHAELRDCAARARGRTGPERDPASYGSGDDGVSIHPSAVIARGAIVPESCAVGPFCTIGPEVELGEDCALISHVVLDGHTRIGARNIFHPFAAVGVAPQDLKYGGESTENGHRRRQHHPRERNHKPRHGRWRRHNPHRLR